ncbi:MAG TPA: hypothetical protein VFW95_01055 [Candidatus Limnocylindria bacterium]|nr:hypothetical protein [Candidatus Limnocylindria bacterium]
MSEPRRFAWIRRPVRREGAERYLLITLVSFAGTVILTRWFLSVTGFPQIGGGDLHVAHALWGGVALFAAALLPILLAGRFVYVMSAALAGIGMGLFIDEVGKFITSANDYFYPAAAPIIYATFLISALVWLRARAPDDPDPRSQLLTALELFEESVEGDLQRSEHEELRERLTSAASRAPTTEQRRLAAALLRFVEAGEVRIAPDPIDRLGGLRRAWKARADRWLGGRGVRVVIVAALILIGIGQLLALWTMASDVSFDLGQLTTRLARFELIHLLVEAVAGALILAGAVLITTDGRHRLGWTLAYFGMLVLVALADLIGFYLRQFDSLLVVFLHVVLLLAVIASRDELRAEPALAPAADPGRMS